MAVEQVGDGSCSGEFFLLPSDFNERIPNRLRRHIAVGEIRSQLMVCMAVRVDESLNIQEQLWIVFLGLFSPSARDIVHAAKPALELMDTKLNGRAFPAEDRLGESRAAVKHRHRHLAHRFSPIRPRYIIYEPGNESDHLL